MERAVVAVAHEVQLQALALDAEPAGHVADMQAPEIGLTGHGAEAGELVAEQADGPGGGRVGVVEDIEHGGVRLVVPVHAATAKGAESGLRGHRPTVERAPAVGEAALEHG